MGYDESAAYYRKLIQARRGGEGRARNPTDGGGSLWLDVALHGIVLWQRTWALSRWLGTARERMGKSEGWSQVRHQEMSEEQAQREAARAALAAAAERAALDPTRPVFVPLAGRHPDALLRRALRPGVPHLHP